MTLLGPEYLADRHPLPRDGWHVAAASCELGDVPMSVVMFGESLVLFRGPDGHPTALDDRCPHRGVALSLGTVCDGRIRCAYHGWRFGRDGVCDEIPSLVAGRSIPKATAVRSWPCHERDGYVWLWCGSGTPAPARPPGIPAFASRVWLQGRLDLDCEAILPIENNLDLVHAYFTHPNLHPQYFAVLTRGFLDQEFDLSVGSTGVSVRNRDPVHQVRLGFELPGCVVVESRSPGRATLIVLHHVPSRTGACRQYWLMSIGEDAGGGAGEVTWSADAPEIFEQDRRVMESAQLAYRSEGAAFERSVEADAPALAVRRLLACSVNDAGAFPKPSTRVLRVRT